TQKERKGEESGVEKQINGKRRVKEMSRKKNLEGERHGRTVSERDREREREMFLYHIVTIYNLLFVCFIYVNCACTFYVNMLWQRCIVCSHANKAFFEFEFEFDR